MDNSTAFFTTTSFSIENPSYHNISDFATATPAKVWGIGLLFVTLISLCAAVGIALMPLLSVGTYNRILTYFIGLGVGSLSGSAIFHLLPQAFGIVDPEGDPYHSYLTRCWTAILGVYLFFIVDKLLKIVIEYKKNLKQSKQEANLLPQNNSKQKHSQLLQVPSSSGDSDKVLPRPSGRVRKISWSPHCSVSHEDFNDDIFVENSSRIPSISNLPKEINRSAMCNHDHDREIVVAGDTSAKKVIANVAWMIIFGDGLHNFIDGLSIGAAFSANILSGISVSVAVLCEEFPHELGDVAILIASGMTLRQALMYNLLSAATCYIGFILGVLVGELNEASSYVFALAGGTFLYISLGNMVPEMNKEMDLAVEAGIGKGFKMFILQSSGVFTGLLTMFLMAYFGSRIQFG